jgi:SpoVK/Ycf46/Vps4 family AAA+-type ATPase
MRNAFLFTGDSGIPQGVDEASIPQLRQWVLKIILELGGWKEFVDNDGKMMSKEIAVFLNLESFVHRYEPVDEQALSLELMKQYYKLENTHSPLPEPLGKNLMQVRRLVGLSETETQILLFALQIHYCEILKEATRLLGELSTRKLTIALSVLLDIDQQEVEAALQPSGRLAQSSLLSIDRSGTYALEGKFDLFSNSFADNMMTLESGVEAMVEGAARRCSPGELSLKDFGHLKHDLSLLVPYLSKVLQEHRCGANILLYGTPGTGKTELTKALGAELGCELFEVSYANEEGYPIDGYRRLRAYGIAQSFFASKRSLILFDEIEDVIDSGRELYLPGRRKQESKAWFNRMLENNAVPTVWITNDVTAIDEALIRRFDLCLEVPVPPSSKRAEILRRSSAGLIGAADAQRIAENADVSPAIVTRAAKVARTIEAHTDGPTAFETVIGNTLKAQRRRPLSRTAGQDGRFDPAFIHTDTNVRQVMEGIATHPDARLCLYGLPGTGKSAFGRWVAEQTQRPLLIKKASSLLSKWIGDTEHNIATAFDDARREGAVLVFDEVDSFLQDRRGAQRSWEVTQVNEMLVQMENYEGIFIATTNLMDGLDPASLRRFDLKLEFRALHPKQAWELFSRECRQLNLRRPNKAVRTRVEALQGLTPGDFAAVERQHRFHPVQNAQDFIQRLEEECALKETATSRKLGFLL